MRSHGTRIPLLCALRNRVALGIARYELAVTPDEIAVARDAEMGPSQVVLVRPDGGVHAVTPSLPAIEALAYDGTTLAFGTGTCVFAGPPPAGAPSPLALDECESASAPR